MKEKTIKEGSELEEGEINEGKINKVPKDKKLFGYNTYYNFEERRKYVDREALNISEEVYNNFLNNIIPKTRILFELIKKYIKNGTSFIKIIEYLEPFLIYEDDISFKQYDTITDFMYEEIQKHIITLRKNKKEFVKFLRGNKTYFVSTILPKLIKRDYTDIFEKKYYNINDSLTTELSLKKLIDFDAGRLYNIVFILK